MFLKFKKKMILQHVKFLNQVPITFKITINNNQCLAV